MKIEGVHRAAEIAAGTRFEMGVHGTIKKYYRIDSKDLPLPVDYGLPVLTRIIVRYALRIPAGSRETVDRALARHCSKCPTAASLAGDVRVEWEAEITETSGR
jgi:hypothetical protein